MDKNELKKKVVDLLQTQGCHTVLLYGSYARGEENETSDIDVMGFRDEGKSYRIGKKWNDIYLDAWIYHVNDIPKLDELLHLNDAIVLTEKNNFGRELLAKVVLEFKKPPPRLEEWETEMMDTWYEKMLGRIKVGDMEAHYRTHMLLYQLLEDWFKRRGVRYLGSKKSLEWMAEYDPSSFKVFQTALSPEYDFTALQNLVTCVQDDSF